MIRSLGKAQCGGVFVLCAFGLLEPPAGLEPALPVRRTGILPIRSRKHLAPLTGFEPAASRATAGPSAIEVQRHMVLPAGIEPVFPP